MQTLNELETAPIPLDEEERRHSKRLLLGLLCALLLTGTLFGGYFFVRRKHERELAAVTASEEAKRLAQAPKVEVIVDEAALDGRKTVLGGTLHNISAQQLNNLAVELELKRRGSGALEVRSLIPDQTALSPDGRARYSVELLAQDYINAKLLRVVSDNQAIPFKALPGAPRPPMPNPVGKTVIVGKPAPKGDEFLNTPNNPGKVP